MRIGFSRAYSSATSAVRPATRPTMKMSFPAGGSKPRSWRIAARAPSILSGGFSDLFGRRALERADESHAVPGDAVPPGEMEQNLHSRINRVDAMAEAGKPGTVAHRPLDCADRGGLYRDAIAARLIGAFPDQRHAPLPGAAVVVPMASTPAAIAAESDSRLPDAARRAAAHDGAPAP